jgi:hypothetical protein
MKSVPPLYVGPPPPLSRIASVDALVSDDEMMLEMFRHRPRRQTESRSFLLETLNGSLLVAGAEVQILITLSAPLLAMTRPSASPAYSQHMVSVPFERLPKKPSHSEDLHESIRGTGVLGIRHRASTPWRKSYRCEAPQLRGPTPHRRSDFQLALRDGSPLPVASCLPSGAEGERRDAVNEVRESIEPMRPKATIQESYSRSHEFVLSGRDNIAVGGKANA